MGERACLWLEKAQESAVSINAFTIIVFISILVKKKVLQLSRLRSLKAFINFPDDCKRKASRDAISELIQPFGW